MRTATMTYKVAVRPFLSISPNWRLISLLNQLTLKQLKNTLEETQTQSYTLFKEASSSNHWQRIKGESSYKGFWDNLEKQAMQLIDKPAAPPQFSDFILFGTTGDRSIYQNKREQLYAGLHTFSMLAMTDNRSEWMIGLENAIWNVCNEFTWVLPAHVGLYHNDYPNNIWDQPSMPRETVDLAAAGIGFTLAEIVHLMGDHLHPWVVERVKAEINRRIFQVYFHDPVPQNWELKTNNWPAVCSASIGAAAIYLVQDSEELAGMLWRVINVLRGYMSGFDEQGATSEGPAYWQYGFSHFVYFAELLKERTNGQISLLSDEKIEQISLFPQFCMLAGGKVVNFSDSLEEVKFNSGLIHRLQSYAPSLQMPPEISQLLPDPNIWLDASRLMLWSDAQVTPKTSSVADPGRAQERIFTGNQWAISKVTDAKGRMIAFAAKGGFNEEPHNHNDLGHFILHVDGENLLADMGIGVYSKQYFQPQYRYELINAGSHGHSVPIVDGCRQGFGKQYRAEIVQYHQTEEEMAIELDLTKAYVCNSLKRLTRHFVWRRPEHEVPQLVILDKVSFSKQPTSFQEVFISSVMPNEAVPGCVQMSTVSLFYDEKNWKVEVEPVSIVSHLGADKQFYRVVLHCLYPKPEMEMSFQFTITEN